MKIVFATNNQHKLQEIRDILGSEFEIVSLKDIGCDVDIPEYTFQFIPDQKDPVFYQPDRAIRVWCRSFSKKELQFEF